MPKTKLKKLEVHEVSLVDAGANQHAKVALFKNREGAPGGDGGQGATGTADPAAMVAEITKACGALQQSLLSIAMDRAAGDKASLMAQSAEEFAKAIQGLVKDAGGKEGGSDGAEGPDDGPEDPQEEAPGTSPVGKSGEGNTEGGMTDMKFNETNMTPAERMVFEDLKKRYGIEEPEADTKESESVGKAAAPEAAEAPKEAPAAAQENVSKAAAQPAPAAEPAVPAAQQEAAPAAGEDIYKGLHPAVRAEIEALKKRAAEADHREMLEVAKKYQILGKAPEELAKTLEGLKAAGGTAYGDMIATLDAAVSMVDNTGVFGEIGKRGTSGNGADAVTKIGKHADEILKAEPSLTYAEAMDRAWAMHPELVDEYENSRRQ